MILLSELEVNVALILDFVEIIRALYSGILEKKYLCKDYTKSLNCDSFLKIANEIKDAIGEESRKGSDVLEFANNIIFRLLKANFFVYENSQMAIYLGYVYLKRQGVEISDYSVEGINNNSTLDDIRLLTKKWVGK